MTRNRSSSTCHCRVHVRLSLTGSASFESLCVEEPKSPWSRKRSAQHAGHQISIVPTKVNFTSCHESAHDRKSRESTTDSPQIQYYYCIPSLPSCSCRHSLVSTATNPATTVPTAAAQWSIPMRNPGEAFCHQSGLPLVQRQTTPASSDPELVVCPPCLVQRLCHPWA
jgi:hypothetical protein